MHLWPALLLILLCSPSHAQTIALTLRPAMSGGNNYLIRSSGSTLLDKHLKMKSSFSYGLQSEKQFNEWIGAVATFDVDNYQVDSIDSSDHAFAFGLGPTLSLPIESEGAKGHLRFMPILSLAKAFFNSTYSDPSGTVTLDDSKLILGFTPRIEIDYPLGPHSVFTAGIWASFYSASNLNTNIKIGSNTEEASADISRQYYGLLLTFGYSFDKKN